ncbi:hypothetical protein BJI47_22565 [Rhodococcus sp. 1168]|nr:hypothetical protein BJI47_22565 [Rhodococcus sp. 1168]
MAEDLTRIETGVQGAHEAIDGRLSKAALDANYAPLWQPSTAYVKDAPVLLPTGTTGKRTTSGTSRPAFDATEQGLWTVAAGGLSQGTADTRYAPRRSRLGAIAFGTGGSNGTFSTGSINPRYPVRLPVGTTRWRLRISNFNIKNLSAGADGQEFRGAWIGPHAFGTSEGTGNFTSAPLNPIPNPGAGAAPIPGSTFTYYTSPWITDPAMQIPAAQNWLLSIQTFASASIVIQRTNMGSYLGFNAGSGGTVAPNPSQSKVGLFDVIIDYEYIDNGENKVGFYIGDSLTEGLGGDNVLGNPNQYNWPSQHSLGAGIVALNGGCSGDRTEAWINATGGNGAKYNRFDLDAIKPDYACILLGTNDSLGLVSLASVQSNMAAILANLQAKGISKVYLGLVPPRLNPIIGALAAAASAGVTSISSSVSIPSGTTIAVGPNVTNGAIAAAASAGATSISSSSPIPNGTQVIIGSGATREVVTTSSGASGFGPYVSTVPALVNAHAVGEVVSNQDIVITSGAPTGAGPYTIPVPALAVAHAAGDLVIEQKENLRQQYNAWIRSVPMGVSGVMDFDTAVRDPAAITNLRSDLHTDGIHLSRLGYLRLAQAAPARP